MIKRFNVPASYSFARAQSSLAHSSDIKRKGKGQMVSKLSDYTEEEIETVATLLGFDDLYFNQKHWGWRDIDTLRMMDTFEARRIVLNIRLRKAFKPVVDVIRRRLGK
jgi:hypothetical protein